jgi:hypothetical protein
MIAIKGMEMPTKCSICPFNAYYENLGEYICEYVGKIIDKDERWEKKLDDCPLVEIVTCKDCKHWHDDGIMTTCDKNIGNGFLKDYYCADGKRRE